MICLFRRISSIAVTISHFHRGFGATSFGGQDQV